MNEAQLKRHAEALLEAYEALNLVWADIGVIKVSLTADNPPAIWMVRDILQKDWEIIGDSLLAITEFTDAMIEDDANDNIE